MALFDKLRAALGSTENKQKNKDRTDAAHSTNFPAKEENSNPLADETINRYFEIICGMRVSLSRCEDAAVEKAKAKKYIEYFLGKVCDEEKLENALALYDISKKEYPSGEEERQLQYSRMGFEKKEEYRFKEIEGRKRFCQEEINAATEEYNKILDVIKDNVNYVHFSQGIRMLNCDYNILLIVIADSFCNGNPITQELIKQYLIDSYTSRINNESYKEYHYVGDDIALLIVKALHFEKYSHDRENYKTASCEDYRNFVMFVDKYKKVIDNHPFEKEQYAEKLAKRITESHVFGTSYTSFGRARFFISETEEYFSDAACHFLLNEIVRKGGWVNEDDEDISETRDYNELFCILVTYFTNQD